MIHILNDLPEQILDAIKWVIIILTLKMALKDLFDFIFLEDYKTLVQTIWHKLKTERR